MAFAYYSRQDINFEKWDACICRSDYPLAYALSWYLDIVTEKKWDALVWGDYEKDFPNPWNQKFVFYRQGHQPFFCQQLGLFSQTPPEQQDLIAAIVFLQKKFKRINLHLHENSSPLPVIKGIEIIPRTNCILPLDRSYEQIFKNYSRRLRRNLLKAERFDIRPLSPITPVRLSNFGEELLSEKITVLGPHHLQTMKNIMEIAISKGMGQIVTVGNLNGICAATFFLFFQNRIINLFGATTELGRESGAMHFLLDSVIRQNAG
ncbi:MAG TPA: hypothetical protein PKC40_00205, partial [Saprospiraceae bacterium]|nr:hypothetical protein [Saprospiraceae bacterium]